MTGRITYTVGDMEIEEDIRGRLEAVLASMDEGSEKTLSRVEVEVRLDDLPEWMFAETSTRDLNRFTITLNRVRYPEAEGDERLWRIAHELGHIVHTRMEFKRGRLRTPDREVILGGDEADANALALIWGFKPPRDIVEDEVHEAYREASMRGIKDSHLLRYITFRTGFDPSTIEEVLRRIRVHLNLL